VKGDAADPWAQFPDATPTPKASGKPDPWAAFPDATHLDTHQPPPAILHPAGPVHDGDTWRLDNGQNARLYGADAYELQQRGQAPGGGYVPLGTMARDYLRGHISPGSEVGLTGGQTFGRPVASLTTDGQDVAQGEIADGWALAAPEYLRSDPERLHQYMEAERQARVNYRGGHNTQAQSPSDFRHHKPDPWAKAEDEDPNKKGGVALFFDEPTPFQGLRPEIEKGYLAVLDDPKSTPADALAYAKTNGFTLAVDQVGTFYRKRAAGIKRTEGLSYMRPPRVLTDLGDGALGASVRGVADPINMLDEAGGVVDSVIPNSLRADGQGRVNVFDNPDQRFGDILANNTEQNRSILDYDEAAHPWARFGGQIGGGLIAPGASIEGLGLRAATKAVEGGASRYTAEQLARGAVTRRLATVGSVEGGLAGAGGGENVRDRMTGTIIGAPLGGALGVTAGVAAPFVGRFARKVAGRLRGVPDAPLAEGLGGDAVDVARMGAQNDLGSNAPSVSPRSVDRLDLGGPKRPADVEVSRGQGGATEPTPVQPTRPARTLEDLQPEIASFAEQHGARPATGGDLPEVMLHGSPNGGIDTFDPYGRSGYGLFGTGTYLTDAPEVAAAYTKKGLKAAEAKGQADQTVYAVRQSVKNPIDMDAPANVAEWERVAGSRADFHEGMTNEQAFKAVEEGIEDEGSVPKWEGAEEMDGVIRGLGYDGITHVGGGRVGNGPRHRVLIALDPEQTEIIGRMSLKDALAPKGPRSPDVLNVAGREGGSPVYSPAEVRASMAAEHGGEALHGHDVWDEFADAPAHLRERINDNEHPEDLEAQHMIEALRPSRRMPGNDNTVETPAETARLDLEHAEERALDAPQDVGAQRVLAQARANFQAVTGLSATGVSKQARPRAVDRIDIGSRARPVLADATEAQRVAQGERIEPGDVLPLPNSAVGSMEEAEAIGAGMRPVMKAPKEAAELASRSIPSSVDGTKTIAKKGPLDLVTWLRTQGGIKAQGGELEHYGIDNTPRAGLDFAAGEGRFGKLVSRDGMTYDDAAQQAWEAGYFPDHAERPSVDEFLDTLNATHTGRNRAFLPGDHAEVDAFEAARAQRHAVEGAREHGAPMVGDRGQPVDLADLEKNTPPVHAYEEWGSQAPTEAGNIRLDKLDTPQDIARALHVTNQRVGGFDAATRGRITQAETESLASELGMTPADLLARRKGQAFNAEQALAARQILAKSGNELVNLAKRVQATENPGDELLAQFRQAWTRHVAIQEQVSGATAEAGRALAQFRMLANSRAVKGDVLKAMAEGPHGPKRLQEAADMIVENAGDPGTMNQLAQKALKPAWKDKIVELYYNSILSGPATHVVNAVSNTMTALGQLPEHGVAAVIGAPRALMKSGSDRVLFSELGARAVGMMQGTKEGMRQAARTFMTGKSSDLISKVESQETHAISGVKGSIIRTPTRALSAADELYKAIARRSELSGLAVRKAAAEGLKGEAATKRVTDLVANPPDDMLAKAFDYGRYVTFQRPLGPLGQSVSRITQEHPLLKLVIPFVRTPVNIMKFAAERSPGAVAMKSWRADVKAGGAARDLALAKMTIGTGVMASAMEMASKGQITGGGPADANAKGMQRADGWQPYSVKIGDKYYSYSRLDPFATTLGVAADFADLQSHMTEKQQTEIALLLTASTIKSLADKTWFSGISDLSAAISDPDRYGASYLRQRVASVAVPGVVAQAARTVDPELHKATTMLDAIRARVPGLSSGLPAQLDIWGKPITNEGGLGPDFVSPVRVSTDRHDPVNAAVLESGATVTAPGKYISGRQLEPEEYEAYARATGALAHQRLTTLVNGSAWKAIPPGSRSDVIETVVRQSRSEVREAMFGPRGDRRRRGPPSKAGGRDPWAAFPDAHAP
jgi:endonuclease YncB( thermonuclease family)